MTKPNTVGDNVDASEIRKFEELASRWWDPQSEFAPLHAINPLRTEYINLRSPVTGLRLLDVGCGGGLISEAMAHFGAKVTGIDMGEAPLNVAKLHLLESGEDVEYLQITTEQLAEQRPGEYDVVTCLEMLEHVPDPASIVAACAKLVKPGGDVYFSTINRNPKAWLFAIVGAEYILNLLPRGTHEYDKLIKPSELSDYARQAGLSLKDMTGLHYNPLTKHYKLGPGVDVNYMIHTKKEH
ncbi:ubiquinone biosynthesis O-methyltransferase [Arenicella chitinivorans]|uniref:Ubiquinone biosynthesis O-methyltransferase n=1 Tax=Arenicella chitinivorans TaxID=1329800 RepID=A0A918RGN4_9GAMM|nr:bifunctional 2-polyprenyl-6-hydroxyphenol methylase/3-demethylubiquinol 3-O-methyltransferase UbiG [Arenicella chitinivorans]GGZ99212.1 ubiquinone biosynthesis O-methyltransferase [Arenicella chitinivorans]